MIVSGLVVLLASTLVACTLSAGAGTVGGIIGTLLLVGALIVGAGATQSGCGDSAVNACLSVDASVFDGAKDAGGEGDIYVGPCLQPPLPDAGPEASSDANPDQGRDVNIGPCLSLPPPDVGPEGGAKDQGREAPIGPCLSLPPPDASSALAPAEQLPRGDALPAGERERRAVVDKLAANLPADVLARLRGEDAKS